MGDWDSRQYTKFEKERTQPSIDLISRISIDPGSILDIGCGPGNSTAQLAKRFPTAEILGVDSSDNMLERAGKTHPKLTFRKCFVPDGLSEFKNFDLIFSNACLHWIPGHETLLPKLMEKLTPGGMLAVQIPLTQQAVFYKLLHELIQADKWKMLNEIHNFHNLTPNATYDVLAGCSGEVAMWETVYYHVVPSHSAVIDWYKGSGLKPYLDALGENEKMEFLGELLEAVKENIPVQGDGNVILKMPRLFFTAKK